MVKPVTRTSIINQKLLAALTQIALTNVVYLMAAKLFADLVKKGDYDVKTFFLMSFTLLFVQLFFLAFGMIISMFMKRLKTVLPVVMGTVFGFYFINMLNQTIDNVKVAVATPFAYVDAAKIFNTGKYETGFLMLYSLLFSRQRPITFTIRKTCHPFDES